MADIPTPPPVQQQAQVQAQNKEQLAEAGKERLRFQLIRPMSDQERLNKDIQQRADKAANTFAGRMRQIIKRYQGETTRLAIRAAKQNMAIADLDIETGLASISNQQALYARRAQEIQTLQERYNEHFTKFAGVLSDKTLSFLQQQSNISAPTLTSIMAGYEMARASAAEREERRLQNDMATIDKLGKLDEQYTNTLLELQKLRNEHKRQQYENNKAILEAEARALDFTTKAEIDTENTLLKFNESDRMYRQSRAQQDSQSAEDVLSQLAAMAGGKNPAGLKPADNNIKAASAAIDQGEFDLIGDNELMNGFVSKVAQQQGVSPAIVKEVFNDYLNIVKYAESRGDGQAVSNDPDSTANGFYQITNTTFRDLKNRIMPQFVNMDSDFAQRVMGAKRAMDLSEEDQATLAVLLAIGRSPARFTKEFRTTIAAGLNGDIDGYGEGLKTIYTNEHHATPLSTADSDNYDKAWNHHGQQKSLWLQQQEQAQAQAQTEQQAVDAGGTQPSTETVTPQSPKTATSVPSTEKDSGWSIGPVEVIGGGLTGLGVWKYVKNRFFGKRNSPAGAQPPPAGTQPPPAGTQPPPAGTQPPPAGTQPPPPTRPAPPPMTELPPPPGETAPPTRPAPPPVTELPPPPGETAPSPAGTQPPPAGKAARARSIARSAAKTIGKAAKVAKVGGPLGLIASTAIPLAIDYGLSKVKLSDKEDDAMVEPPQFASLGDADKKALLSAANDEEVFSILDNLQQSGLDIANEEKIYWATYLNKLRGAK